MTGAMANGIGSVEIVEAMGRAGMLGSFGAAGLSLERIAQAIGMDVGGVEVMVDERDGLAKFYDINVLSNFVAKPVEVLGWDPHDRLVDWLKTRIAEARA